MMLTQCFVCAAQSGTGGNFPWYDEPIHQVTDGGLTLLGVGAIAPGYLLACPPVHVPSLSALPPAMVAPFLSLVSSASTDLTRRFGRVLIFEHGGCNAPAHTSACVDHAHLHLWAIADHVRLTLTRYWRSFPDLTAFFTASSLGETPAYLLHSDESGTIWVGPDVGAPQFFRRQVAVQLGHADEWDYAVCAFEQNMIDTRDSLLSMRGYGQKS